MKKFSLFQKQVYLFLLMLSVCFASMLPLAAQTIGGTNNGGYLPLQITFTQNAEYLVSSYLSNGYWSQFWRNGSNGNGYLAPLFAIRVGNNVYCQASAIGNYTGIQKFDRVINVQTTATGPVHEVTKRYEGSHPGGSFSVTIKATYNIATPNILILEATIINGTNSTASISYGFDAFAGNSNYGFAYILPNTGNSNNSSPIRVVNNISPASLHLVAVKNLSVGAGAIAGFFPIGNRKFSRMMARNEFYPWDSGVRYGEPVCMAQYPELTQNQLQFGPYNQLNGVYEPSVGVAYDGISVNATTVITTGVIFATNGDELNYFMPIVAAPAAPATKCAGSDLVLPATPTVTTYGSAPTSSGWQIESGINTNVYGTLNMPYTLSVADHGKKIRYYATNSYGTGYSAGVAITVTAAPTILLSSGSGTNAQTVNKGSAITNITYTFSNATGATVTGLSPGLQQSVAGNTLTISGTPTASCSYLVSTTGNLSPCTAATATGTITVIPVTTVIGTVFPFVRWNIADLDQLFTITINLKSIPNPQSINPLGDLKNETPLYSTKAIYYNGSIFVPNSPKSPGMVGALNNYGLFINWMDAIHVQGGTSTTHILVGGEQPVTINGSTLGLYKIENVKKGDYILEIKRESFVTRWAKIKVDANAQVEYFGHRELIAGDIDDNYTVNATDVALEKLKIGGNYMAPHTHYEAKYDLNADGQVNLLDFNLILKFTGFKFHHYQETKEWLDALEIRY
jgi:hypothetical protein